MFKFLLILILTMSCARKIADNELIVGDGSGADVVIEADVGDVDNPKIRFNNTDNVWEQSNDGLAFTQVPTQSAAYTDTCVLRADGTNKSECGGVDLDDNDVFLNVAGISFGATLDSKLVLDVTGSTSKGTKPFTVVTTAQRNAIASPITNMKVFNSDTGSIEYYTGSSWVGFLKNTILTTKGDLVCFNGTTYERFPVGSAGQIIVPDATEPCGFKWANNPASATNDNYIINGNFDFWQQGTSLGSGTGIRRLADRFRHDATGSTYTVSRQAITQPSSELFNASYFLRKVVTSSAGASNRVELRQYIEDVTRLACKEVTLSFWAKAAANRDIAIEFFQDFGSGGSPSATVNTIGVTTHSLTTSWQKFTQTFTIPCIDGKTLGTDGIQTTATILNFWFDCGSTFSSRCNSLGQQSGTFDIAQIKLEDGDSATPFVLAGKTIQGELAACQRYYYTPTLNYGSTSGMQIMQARGTGTVIGNTYYPVQMRITPTVVTFGRDEVAGRIEQDGTTTRVNATLSANTERGIHSFSGTFSSDAWYRFHFTADAEF
jgi:hypothetical protein